LHLDPPHILCLTEHHLHCDELASLHIENYTFGTYCYRKLKHKGGVCMSVYNSIKFTSLNIDNYYCNVPNLQQLSGSNLNVICCNTDVTPALVPLRNFRSMQKSTLLAFVATDHYDIQEVNRLPANRNAKVSTVPVAPLRLYHMKYVTSPSLFRQPRKC
jgi:hypothetical protein